MGTLGGRSQDRDRDGRLERALHPGPAVNILQGAPGATGARERPPEDRRNSVEPGVIEVGATDLLAPPCPGAGARGIRHIGASRVAKGARSFRARVVGPPGRSDASGFFTPEEYRKIRRAGIGQSPPPGAPSGWRRRGSGRRECLRAPGGVENKQNRDVSRPP
ncbi:hypothetical protein NDU88_005658 [Pleurodeles waltl]|uniref:Uncharacterized protein n=1 Tax=Pleurodeles waltl TaxID=8319 RepID=A0AAV7W8P1_PLEWA|nr:hypothetical protein NDU88_005658 [Pleurodeles waltl]